MHHGNSNGDIIQLDTRLPMMDRCAHVLMPRNDKMLTKMKHCNGPTGDVQLIENRDK